jgi:mannose-6-phosphate isomerase-like protein (cupin superfamily)
MSFLLLSTVDLVPRTVSVALCDPRTSGAEDRLADSQPGGDTLHTLIPPTSVKWNPANAEMSIAVLSGSPDVEDAPFVIRLKLADGTRMQPHWHPIDEHLTVVSGSFHMGIGERFDKSIAKAMSAGIYCLTPKEVRHFGWATGETVLQIHGVGPLKTFFVETSTVQRRTSLCENSRFSHRPVPRG